MKWSKQEEFLIEHYQARLTQEGRINKHAMGGNAGGTSENTEKITTFLTSYFGIVPIQSRTGQTAACIVRPAQANMHTGGSNRQTGPICIIHPLCGKFFHEPMLQNVYLVDDSLSLVDAASVTALEERIGTQLPAGYRSFVTTLGEGVYCDRIYVFRPEVIESETASLRKSLEKHFFWDRGDSVLPKRKVITSTQIARSLDGDEIIYNPDTEKGIYVLPRHDDTIYWLDSDFSDPIAWHSESGMRVDEPPFRYFEPVRNRKCIEMFTARTDHVLTDIVAMIENVLSNEMEVRRITEPHYVLLFLKAIGGRVQFTTSADDPRIGVRFDFNGTHRSAVRGCTRELESKEFFKVGS